jgi:CheY-like chemotaxis protein
MRAILELALKIDPEIEAEIFSSGSALLERARFGDVDAILLDVMMPPPDGYSTCRTLKADPVTAPIPVIFLTAKSDALAQEQARTVGAKACLAKPFDPRTLATILRETLR